MTLRPDGWPEVTAREPIATASAPARERTAARSIHLAPLRTLPGGIHPAQEKQLSRTVPIRTPALPERLVLPLQQHVGAAAEPLVEIGQQVLKGEPLAAARGWVSLPLHAPTSGIIRDIGVYPAPHPSGLPAHCIVLEPDGEDRWTTLHPVADWRSAATDTLLDALRAAGIAGLGGAGFPTAVKLTPRPDRTLDTLIVNGAECEPYITADDRLMCERADDIVGGIEILLRLVRPERCLIGIEDNKPEAIAAIETAVAGLAVDPDRPAIHIVVVPTRYPSGGEKQLIQLLTDREVPSGGLPSDIGVLCLNVATAAAARRAVAFGEPVISRITTLTGRALDRPGNIEALLGTPFSHLLAEAGLREADLGRLLMGGPMMGFTITDAAVGVVKTTNCILAATSAELPPPPPAQPCIRCGMCEQVCPASLLPQQLFWFARDDDFEAARDHDLADCIECGACAWVCPSAIPLVRYYRYAKGELRRQREDTVRAERARDRFEFHQARVEAEQQEREAKRRARAAAARQRKEKEAARQLEEKAAASQSDENAEPVPTVSGAVADAGATGAAGTRPAPGALIAGNPGDTTGAPATGTPAADTSAATGAADPGSPPAPPQIVASSGTPSATAAPSSAQKRAQLETLRARRRQLDAELHAARQAHDPAAVERSFDRMEDLDRRIAQRETDLGTDGPAGSSPQTGPGAATPYAGADEADLEQLTAEADRAQSRARKARSAIKALQAGGADERKLAAMRASLERLEETAREADAALGDLHVARGDEAAGPPAPGRP